MIASMPPGVRDCPAAGKIRWACIGRTYKLRLKRMILNDIFDPLADSDWKNSELNALCTTCTRPIPRPLGHDRSGRRLDDLEKLSRPVKADGKIGPQREHLHVEQGGFRRQEDAGLKRFQEELAVSRGVLASLGRPAEGDEGSRSVGLLGVEEFGNRHCRPPLRWR